MSYCRWSSDNWMCDVYVYEDCNGGWTTHVAGSRRIIGPIPDLMGGNIGHNVHLWLRPDWDKDMRKVQYPDPLRKIVGKVWYSLVAFWHSKIHLGSLGLIPLRPICLPHDGESFNDETPRECAERLLELRRIGYRVPQYAIDTLIEESTQSLAGEL